MRCAEREHHDTLGGRSSAARHPAGGGARVRAALADQVPALRRAVPAELSAAPRFGRSRVSSRSGTSTPQDRDMSTPPRTAPGSRIDPRRTATRHALALVLALCAACDSPVEPRGRTGALILSAQVEEPGGPIFRTLHLRLDSPAGVEVEYWTDDAPRLRVRRDAAADSQVVPLARLRADRTYEYEARAIGADGRPGPPFTGQFTTGPLPADLAAISFTATGTPGVPLVLLHLYRQDGFAGYAAVEGSGSVVWYYRTVDLPFGIARRANGNFIAMDKGRGLLELTPAGEVLHELPQDEAGRNQHHDAITTPQNTVLFIAFDWREYDGRPIAGEAIWEWEPETGVAVKRWSAHDFLDPAVDRTERSTDDDWLHANSLAIGARGNILVSLRRLNQIISIAPDWSAIEWRLGGPGATIPFADGDLFTGQHTAAEVALDRILLFDNRHDLGGYSRAAEYDISGGEARTVWEWRPARDNFAFAVSSARRLAGGNTLVGFGMSPGLNGSTGPIEVYEVSPAGEVLWHLVVDGPFVMYRAEPLQTIAGETIVTQ